MGPVFFFSIPPPSAPPRNSAPPAPCSCAPWLLWGGEERAGRRGGVYVRARARARSPPARVGGPTGSGEWRSAPPRPPAALISLSFFSSLAPPRARGAKEKKREREGPLRARPQPPSPAREGTPPLTMASPAAAPPITPTPVEPCVETEPAYWFRRVGELTFSRPPAAAGGDGPLAPLPGSSRRVVAAPAAGVVAFSDGRGAREIEGGALTRKRAPMHQQPAPTPPLFFLAAIPSRSSSLTRIQTAVYLARTAALLAAAVRVEEGW